METDHPARSDAEPLDWDAGGSIALVSGVLGVVGAVWAYWLIVPGMAFGVVAVVLGARARRRGRSDVGAVALTLGAVALFLVPSVLITVDGAEDWGRHCALNPSDPDC